MFWAVQDNLEQNASVQFAAVGCSQCCRVRVTAVTICFQLLQVGQVRDCHYHGVIVVELVNTEDGTVSKVLYAMDEAAHLPNGDICTKLKRFTPGE
jgi:hypothetical protein